MTPERAGEIERIFHAAAECPPDERGAFLAEACAGDDALRREVESLLAQEPGAAGFLSTPAVAATDGPNPDGSSFIGRQLGSYEVLSLIDVGGMGMVYRARDVRLDREVAIKILMGAEADHSRRLLDEAKAASALNHPNIVTVYDVGTTDGVPFVVSEFVQGKSLRTLVSRAPLPVRDVLALAVQIADGLAAAHQAGIVHRDIKPENVRVTPDGRVKILDFGLALVRGAAVASGETRTLALPGLIMGTVPYMSPEQARGAEVDYRTDQFSLGLTLYELLTGRQAFRAETPAQVLASIIEDEPPAIATINPRVPAPLRWVIERCLAKDPRQRYHATADLAAELRILRDRLPEFVPATDAGGLGHRGRRLAAVVGMGIAVVAAILGLLGGIAIVGDGFDLNGYRFTPIATDAGYQRNPAWSPDGKTLAYEADIDGVLQVFTRALTSSGRAQVTHSRFDCNEPFWSPDGTRIYYTSLARSRTGLWSISAVGGEPELVMENVSRAALSPDGKTLAFFRSAENDSEDFQRLWLSAPPGAAPVAYTRPPFGTREGYISATLHFSPDGSKLGVWVEGRRVEMKSIGPDASPEFWVLPMGDAPPRLVRPPALDANWLAASFSWLPDNRRVLSALPYPRPGLHLWLTDTERQSARLVTTSSGIENAPSVSPDGTRVAVAHETVDYDLYQLSVEHPTPSVVLASSRNEMSPSWSGVSDQFVYATDRTGREEIWLRSRRGEWERPLVTPDDFGADPTQYLGTPAFSPDGQRVAYNRQGSSGNRIWITPVAGGPPVQLSVDDYFQEPPSWSPDGEWIAYLQAIRGEWSLVRKRVGSRPGAEVLASDVLPFSPVRWAPDNSWIGYNARGGLSRVSIEDKSTKLLQEQPWHEFEWSADSRRIYGIRLSDDFKHLTFASVDAVNGAERVLAADMMALPLSPRPVRGFTRISPTTFVTSIVRSASEIWVLDGFNPKRTLAERLQAFLFWRR